MRIVVVETSAPKVYPRVTLASARVGGKDLEGWRRTSKDVLSSPIDPWAPPQPVFDCRWLLFIKGTQGVWPGLRRARRTASARLLMAMQSLGHENPPYTSTIREFAGCGSISVLRMMVLDVGDAWRLGWPAPITGGSLRFLLM